MNISTYRDKRVKAVLGAAALAAGLVLFAGCNSDAGSTGFSGAPPSTTADTGADRAPDPTVATTPDGSAGDFSDETDGWDDDPDLVDPEYVDTAPDSDPPAYSDDGGPGSVSSILRDSERQMWESYGDRIGFW
jgi:hypothetical protein